MEEYENVQECSEDVRVEDLSNIELGRKGEDIATALVERLGMDVVERNWRDPHAAEADIIAIDDEEIVFIEVKTRRNYKFGAPEEAITLKKQQQYRKLAKQYLALHPEEDRSVRFDSIGISVLGDNHAIIRHVKAAFDGEAA